MNFSGTIDETNGMTMTRLIERIVHTDTPGELRLHDEASGRKATVAIRRGMVEEVAFGDLTGDPALTAISQVMPWTFEFVGDEAGAVPSHPSMVSRRPRSRAVVRAPKPAAAAEPETTPDKPAGAAETVTTDKPTVAEEPAVADEPPMADKAAADGEPDRTADAQVTAAAGESPVSEEPAVPEEPPTGEAPAAGISLSASHREWIASPASDHCIHFGTCGGEFAGGVHEDDHDYFRSDFGFLASIAAGIARSLDLEPPVVMAIAEPERATGYCRLDGGFLGVVGGAGTGVTHVIDFPPATP